MVTGSFDKTAKIWDAVSGTELLTLKGARCATFSSDGARVVTGNTDNTAKFWGAVDWTISKEELEKQKLERYQAWLKNHSPQ
mgnify:FL=1